MVTKTESKEQWKGTSSLSSSSRSSSITTDDETDGHFDIRHFPLPKPILSAAEAQRQRETHQAYSSSVSSYTSSTWSSVQLDLPGYDPNRILSSIFSSKPGNSLVGNSSEWSIASNESLFSIHDMNFTMSTTTLKLGEIPKLEETVLDMVNKREESDKETLIDKKPNREVKPLSEIDDEMIEEVIIELESDDEHEEIEKDTIEEEVLVEDKTEKQEEKEIVEYVKETKHEYPNATSIASHSPSISCRSDNSSNSINSFVFPVLQKDDAITKTPVMEISKRVSQKRRPEYLLPQSPKQPLQPHPQFYQESGSLNRLNPQRMDSDRFESRTKSLKDSRNGLFSCFRCKLGFN